MNSKAIILTFYALALFISCSKMNQQEGEITDIYPSTKVPMDNVVFDADSGQYLYPQESPFEIGHIQKAYDIIANGAEHFQISKETKELFYPGCKIAANHLALIVWPSSLEEQRKIELDTDIRVSYTPFGYTRKDHLIQEQYAEAGFTNVNSAVYDTDTLVEEYQYSPSKLYVVWPLSKPIPETLEYSICQELYIPRYYYGVSLDDEYDRALEMESLFLCGLIEDQPTKADSGRPSLYPDGRDGRQGYLKAYDNTLGEYVPLCNVKVQIGVSGVPMLSEYTDSTGFFAFSVTCPMSYSVNFIFQNTQWTVCEYPYPSPSVISPGSVRDIWGTATNTCSTINLPTSGISTIQRGAAYIYRNSGLWEYQDSNLSITYHNTSSPDGYAGAFWPVSRNIDIYPNSASRLLISTVCHEIGHSIQRQEKGAYLEYNSNPKILRESFASFMGWYYGRQYYIDNGFVEPYDGYMINDNSRQSWDKNSSSWYTPLFVDMVDTYNQGISFNSRPYDSLSGCPLSIIRELSIDCTNIASLKQRVLNSVAFFNATESDVLVYFRDYDYWVNNNGYEY